MLLARTPHAIPTEALAAVAAAAHGHVGADLAAVCKEAGLVALKRCLRTRSENGVPSAENGVPRAALHHEPVSLTLADLWQGLRLVRPSAMREVAIDIPTVRWSDIGGQLQTKQQIQEAVQWPLAHPEVSPPSITYLF